MALLCAINRDLFSHSQHLISQFFENQIEEKESEWHKIEGERMQGSAKVEAE